MNSTDANGPNGPVRDAAGRWTRGNPGGPGSKKAKQVARLHEAVAKAVTPAEITAVMRQLYLQATNGCTASASLLLERTLGKSKPASLPLQFTGELGTDAAAVVQAAGLQLLDPSVARELLGLLGDAAGLEQLGTLEQRLAELEARHATS